MKKRKTNAEKEPWQFQRDPRPFRFDKVTGLPEFMTKEEALSRINAPEAGKQRRPKGARP